MEAGASSPLKRLREEDDEKVQEPQKRARVDPDVIERIVVLAGRFESGDDSYIAYWDPTLCLAANLVDQISKLLKEPNKHREFVAYLLTGDEDYIYAEDDYKAFLAHSLTDLGVRVFPKHCECINLDM